MTARATEKILVAAAFALAALPWPGSAVSHERHAADAEALRTGRSSVEAAAVLAPRPLRGDATLAFLERRVAEDPLDIVALNRLALVALETVRRSGDFAWLARATRAAEQSLEAVPADRNPEAMAALALSQLEAHRFADAATTAKRAIVLDAGNRRALAIAGDAELELGNYDGAVRLYAALDDGSASPALLARQARLAELRGDNELALELLGRALDPREEGDGWARIRRGEIFLRTGRLDRAEAEFLAAPDGFDRSARLAALRAAQGRTAEAIALYEALAAQTPRAEVFQALGDLHAHDGRKDEAARWHERAEAAYLASVERGEGWYLHHLAGFYSDSVPDADKALLWARRDLETRRSIQAWDALAWALYRKGKFAEAASAMNEALKLGTADAHLLERGGLVYWRAGELDKGRALLSRVAKVNPGYEAFHVHY